MATRAPARLTAAQGRSFGFVVGFAFAAIGLFLVWRGRSGVGAAMLSVGGVLVLGGLIVPTRLGPLERAWTALAHAISRVTTPVFMAVVYYLILTPAGYIRRLSGGPMAGRPRREPSRWTVRSPDADAAAQLERQF